MNRTIRVSLSMLAVAVLAVSCAKEPEDDLTIKQQQAFDAWVSLNDKEAVKQPSGIYINRLTEPSDVVKPPRDGDWILLDYTGKVLFTGDVFVSRDSTVARQQGTFQTYTHYAPEFIRYKSDGSLISGVYDALSTMNQGERAIVYIPYTLAYGAGGNSFDNGYQGQVSSVSSYTPIIMDLNLLKIVSDPTVYENDLVSNYATGQWKLPITDTLKANMYRRQLSPAKDTTTVRRDTSASVYYVGRFLDGFVFDTNIADTAIKYNIYKKDAGTKYDSITLSLSSGDTTYVKGFYDGVLGMQYGEVSQVVFTSAYGYGSSGKSASSATVIGPYSPLVFTLQVLPRNGDGTYKHPYSIKGVKEQKDDEDGVWAMGYVVGAVEGTDVVTQAKFSDTITVKTNILLADTRTAKEASKVIAVELPEGEIRDKLNMADNAKALYRKKIAVYGNIQEYLGQIGITDVTKYNR